MQTNCSFFRKQPARNLLPWLQAFGEEVQLSGMAVPLEPEDGCAPPAAKPPLAPGKVGPGQWCPAAGW